jgi:hypothetical protein
VVATFGSAVITIGDRIRGRASTWATGSRGPAGMCGSKVTGTELVRSVSPEAKRISSPKRLNGSGRSRGSLGSERSHHRQVIGAELSDGDEDSYVKRGNHGRHQGGR